MIEQGLKVFTAVYKRVYRSLRSEYKKLYRLNRLYMDEKEYYRVLDSQNAVFRADYDTTDLDIIPVADPTISSEAQRLARSQAEFETMEMNPTKGGRVEILRRRYQALQVPDIDKLLPPAEIQAILAPQQPPPNPELLKLEAQITKNQHDFELALDDADQKRLRLEADIQLVRAQAIKAIADAEKDEAGHQFEQYKFEVDQLSTQVKLAIDAMKARVTANATTTDGTSKPPPGDTPAPDAGAGGGVEAVPGNQGSPPLSPGGPGKLPGATGTGGDLESLVSGAHGTTDLQNVGANLRAKFNAGSPIP